MNLDANLLNKFAETINAEEPVVNTTTEFFGEAKELDTDGFWIVIPDAISSEELSEENYVRCSYEGVLVKSGNRVKYKIENGEAAIIANLDTPNGIDIAIVNMSKEGVTFVQGESVTSGYAIVKIDGRVSEDLDELLGRGYKILGVQSMSYKVRGAWQPQSGDRIEVNSYTDPASNSYSRWLQSHILPYIHISTYKYEDNAFYIYFTSVGSSFPIANGSQHATQNWAEYKVNLSIVLSMPNKVTEYPID